MKAVFEELNGDIAVFVVDDVSRAYYLDVAELPKGSATGDVFAVEIVDDEKLILSDKLPAERERREKSSRAKREELLKRKNKE